MTFPLLLATVFCVALASKETARQCHAGIGAGQGARRQHDTDAAADACAIRSRPERVNRADLFERGGRRLGIRGRNPAGGGREEPSVQMKTLPAFTDGPCGEELSGPRPIQAPQSTLRLPPPCYGVARHSLRAALRQLQAEGLVTIEPNRGAARGRAHGRSSRSASCGPRSRSRPRGSRSSATAAGMPKAVHDAVRLMDAVCAQPDPPWSAVVEAHAAVHRAIVAAAASPRILRAYDGLAGELHLYVIGIRPGVPARPHGRPPRRPARRAGARGHRRAAPASRRGSGHAPLIRAGPGATRRARC